MPSPGDLIEIIDTPFDHWAVYVGDGYVVHLVNLGNRSTPGKQRGKIRKQKLKDVTGKDKWRVNNEVDKKRRPRPAQEIVDDALSMVGDDVEYDGINYNCEHFATWLRSGEGESPQVVKGTIIAGVAGGIIGGALGFVAGPAGAAGGAAVGSAIAKGAFAVLKKI